MATFDLSNVEFVSLWHSLFLRAFSFFGKYFPILTTSWQNKLNISSDYFVNKIEDQSTCTTKKVVPNFQCGENIYCDREMFPLLKLRRFFSITCLKNRHKKYSIKLLMFSRKCWHLQRKRAACCQYQLRPKSWYYVIRRCQSLSPQLSLKGKYS